MERNSAAQEQISAILDRQNRAHTAAGPATAEQRRARIQRVIDLLVARADDIAKALDADFGGRPDAAPLRVTAGGDHAQGPPLVTGAPSRLDCSPGEDGTDPRRTINRYRARPSSEVPARTG